MNNKKRFIKIELMGSYCIMVPGEAREFMREIEQDGEADQIDKTEIYLTTEEFESLEDFQGF